MLIQFARIILPVGTFSTFQMWHDIHRHQAAGERVPNSLWWPRRKWSLSRRISVALIFTMLTPSAASTFWTLYKPSQSLPTLGRMYLQDLAVLVGSVMLIMFSFQLFMVFDSRWFRLWSIRSMRRRMTRQSLGQRRTFFSSRSTPRRLALLLGVALYFPLLFAAAGVGNMPQAVIVVSSLLGHARALPIVLFPIAAEILAGLYRRRRRRRSVNAWIESRSLQTAS